MIRECFPDSEAAFVAMWNVVESAVDSSARFPAWPFRSREGSVVLYEYDRVLGGDFGAVLRELASAYGDDAVTVAGIEPDKSYYYDAYRHFPAFRVSAAAVHERYGEALMWEPRGDPTGALGHTLNIVAMTGTSRAWSVFAQRDWEVGLLLTPKREGAWLTAGVPWFEPDIDLASIRSPAGWGMPLSEADVARFYEEIGAFGSER